MKKSTHYLSLLAMVPLLTYATSTQTIETPQEVVEITIPTPPVPPKPVQLKVNNTSSQNMATATTRTIQFSKRTPPHYTPGGKITPPQEKESSLVGDIVHGNISAYLRAAYMTPQEVTNKLKAAGFEIVATVAIDSKGELTTIIFTHPTLQQMAKEPQRGFAASLRVLVDSKTKLISITNPLYITKAFLQKTFDKTNAHALLASLNKAFTGLKGSKDALKFQLLPKYQFMQGMPTYNDMAVVAEGNDLVARLKANKKLLFEQKLSNGATLVGIKLSEATNSFPATIGTKNAALLPYPALIENNKAYILDPRYYISVMYPNLKMSEFMKIMNVPDEIIKECRHAF